MLQLKIKGLMEKIMLYNKFLGKAALLAILVVFFSSCATTGRSLDNDEPRGEVIVLGEVYFETDRRASFQQLLDAARLQYPDADYVIDVVMTLEIPKIGFGDPDFVVTRHIMSGTAIQYIPEPTEPTPIPVRFAVGGIFGVTNTLHYESFIWRNNRYELEFAGYSRNINWLQPMLSFRFLFPFQNNLSWGFGVDASLALFGHFISETLTWDHNITGGSFALYGIIGHNNLFFHLGYDLPLGALYFSPNLKINDRLLIGFPVSLFGNNNRGLVSIFIPPQHRVAPQESFVNARYSQFGLSVQYVFGRQR